MKWIRDEEFIRGSIPMTKFEARVLIMALLEAGEGDRLLDIGAGTGSVSIQAALLGAKVFAIEREREGVELIQKNAQRFHVGIEIVHGSAPEATAGLGTFSKCFIGGSGGSLKAIFDEADRRLQPGGILAASFIVPDNMVELKKLFADRRYSEVEVRLIQASVLEGNGLLKANNPIFLIRGKKQ
ncbi:MAG TPA: precorrin-6Y C5,15-methyltransferase (decarboxylating) subunit CbiT [Negativicutes bacterium]|nr:precorrin-6Y C5,15-methyltransferase (decarboxylating) subunit CbiT [Negativicutes bacterium]